ncbi:phospholipase D family protein [Ornithinimicrobium kibberense]|uniref:PLD phosphodiesterase domain-containing protein n=1 Tax=Ornithinimicrobium kibberense TaxID=282060 RepID=A0ABV5V3U7_9MICO|nr:phospholipase D family protein [Ornithinimicrobium kibberense]
MAVGTTYTLNLRMLFLPPLAMAAHDREVELLDGTDEADHAQVDTLALLESVRRYADRTTVYCHASGIGSPGTYPRLLTFAEDCVVQVFTPTPGHIFHPKVWALRFRRDAELVHRLVVCSRNLTDDSSWDTLLVLDEGERGTGIPGAPAADFVRALPGMAAGPIAENRPEQAHDLASSLSDVWFQLPKPFTSGELRPLGLRPAPPTWPMPARADRAVVISPFLDVPTSARIAARTTPVLVSREETYALVGARAVQHTSVKVLSPHAEGEIDGDLGSERVRPSEVRTGLHAKVLVWDEGHTGHVFTGSANATHAAFNGNVEFGVLLRGPRRTCGVEALLPDGEASRDRITFAHVLQDHEITDPDPGEDLALEAEREAELHHEALLQAGPRLLCEQEDEGRYAVSLRFTRPFPAGPGPTRVRLVSRPRTDAAPPDRARWEGVQLMQLTPYLEIVTHVPVPGQDDLEVASVLKAELVDAPEDRAAQVLRSYLGSEESIVRYLRFLLDEAEIGSVWDDLELEDPAGEGRRGPSGTFEDLAILEPLLRAAADGSETLDRVEALLRDLGAGPERPNVVPEEFLDLWQAVWRASQERRR